MGIQVKINSKEEFINLFRILHKMKTLKFRLQNGSFRVDGRSLIGFIYLCTKREFEIIVEEENGDDGFLFLENLDKNKIHYKLQ